MLVKAVLRHHFWGWKDADMVWDSLCRSKIMEIMRSVVYELQAQESSWRITMAAIISTQSSRVWSTVKHREYVCTGCIHHHLQQSLNYQNYTRGSSLLIVVIVISKDGLENIFWSALGRQCIILLYVDSCMLSCLRDHTRSR